MNKNGGMYISYLVKTQKQRLLELAYDMKIGLEGAPWEGLRNECTALLAEPVIRSWPVMKDLENHTEF